MTVAAQASSVLLTVRETGGVDRRVWPITCGVPFADGQVQAEDIAAGHWRLLDLDGREVPSQAQVATVWGIYPTGPNGFAKWVHLTFLAEVAAGQEKQYRLDYGQDIRNGTKTRLSVADKSKNVTITTGKGVGALKLVISREAFNVLDEVYVDVKGDGFGADDRIIAPREEANLSVGYDYGGATINRNRPEVTVEQSGPVMAVVRIKTKPGQSLRIGRADLRLRRLALRADPGDADQRPDRAEPLGRPAPGGRHEEPRAGVCRSARTRRTRSRRSASARPCRNRRPSTRRRRPWPAA